MLSLTLAISSKLCIWSETLKLLCPFYMCSMRQFKCFSNLGISCLYLNSFINMQSQSCGLLAFLSTTHLSRFVQIDLKRTLKVIFIATHHWWRWEVVGTTSLCEFMWKWTGVSQTVSLCFHLVVLHSQKFFFKRSRRIEKNLSLLFLLWCLDFLKLNFLILKLQTELIVSFSVIFVYICVLCWGNFF